MEQDRHLLIVGAGVVAVLDDEQAELAGVGALVQVAARADVAVVPAGAGRIRREHVALAAAVGRHARRAFLVRAVDVRRDVEPVPVDDVFVFGSFQTSTVSGVPRPGAQDSGPGT